MLWSLFKKLAGPFLIEEDLKLKSLVEIRLRDLFKTLFSGLIGNVLAFLWDSILLIDNERCGISFQKRN